MATRRLMIDEGLLEDASGSVLWDSSVNYDTNDLFPHKVLAFLDTSTKLVASGDFEVPDDYVGSAEIEVIWRCSPTSGNVVWEVKYRTLAGDNTDSMDPSSVEETASVTDGAGGAAWRRMVATITLTSANLAAGESVLFQIARDGSSGSDTMAGTALIESIRFKYSNT